MKVKVNWLSVLAEVVRVVLAALAGGAAGGAI